MAHRVRPNVRAMAGYTRGEQPQGGAVIKLNTNENPYPPTPRYLLYRTMAEIQGARFETVPYTADWQLPSPWPLPQAQLTFVANPNSPSGTTLSYASLERLAGEVEGTLVVDEAYVDFAEG